MSARKISPKKFLLIYFSVYLVIAITWAVMYKSPGHTTAFMEANVEVHEHYLEIVKSEPYKHYEQRPHLIEQYYERHPHAIPDHAHLMAGIKFVEEYTSRPAFVAEEQRMARYNVFFDVYNTIAVVVLAVWFGWSPLMGFLDQRIGDVRTRIERAENRRKTALERLESAKAQFDGLAEERARIEEQVLALAEQDRATMTEMTDRVREEIEKEARERAELEHLAAAKQLRTDLITQAAVMLEAELKRAADERTQDQMVDEFTEGLRAHTAAGGRAQ